MKPIVLISDGNAALCRIYSSFLTKRGYDVETSTDGLDCLAKLRRLRPIALVLDQELHWGGSDGVLAYLREESQMPWVPVLLLVNAGSTEPLPELLQPPIVQCLQKPFSLTVLLESIRDAHPIGPRPHWRESADDNALTNISQMAHK